jgi:hypothetical protein
MSLRSRATRGRDSWKVGTADSDDESRSRSRSPQKAPVMMKAGWDENGLGDSLIDSSDNSEPDDNSVGNNEPGVMQVLLSSSSFADLDATNLASESLR